MHHRFQLFFGRHHGGRGFGRFGRGFMAEDFADGGGLGGRAFGMGRKLASVDLQLLIAALLAEKPSHGYEIIKALEERSRGFYVPSPGMVYPALTYLEEIGHATIELDGTRKLYHLTDAGREYLAQHRARADAMLAQLARVGEKIERMRRAFGADAPDVEPAGSQGHRGSKELAQAARELKSAIRDRWDAPREEQQRVADILKRASAEICGKS